MKRTNKSILTGVIGGLIAFEGILVYGIYKKRSIPVNKNIVNKIENAEKSISMLETALKKGSIPYETTELSEKFPSFYGKNDEQSKLIQTIQEDIVRMKNSDEYRKYNETMDEIKSLEWEYIERGVGTGAVLGISAFGLSQLTRRKQDWEN